MDTSRAFWVICITLFLVIVINAGIYLAFSKRKPDSFSSTFGKAAREMRNPWQRDDERMAELSERIAGLRKADPTKGDDAENRGDQETHG